MYLETERTDLTFDFGVGTDMTVLLAQYWKTI